MADLAAVEAFAGVWWLVWAVAGEVAVGSAAEKSVSIERNWGQGGYLLTTATIMRGIIAAEATSSVLGDVLIRDVESAVWLVGRLPASISAGGTVGLPAVVSRCRKVLAMHVVGVRQGDLPAGASSQVEEPILVGCGWCSKEDVVDVRVLCRCRVSGKERA